jgi:hypothetical protein
VTEDEGVYAGRVGFGSAKAFTTIVGMTGFGDTSFNSWDPRGLTRLVGRLFVGLTGLACSGGRCAAGTSFRQDAAGCATDKSAASSRRATSAAIATGVAANPTTSPVIRGVPA